MNERDEAILRARDTMMAPNDELKYGHVETIKKTIKQYVTENPWASSGAFATVYKFRERSGTICALRCFKIFPDADIQMRYEHIGPYFEKHIPEITANFVYYQQGLQVGTTVFPIVRMDWIDGPTLLEHVKMLCAQPDPAGLRDLSEQWLQLILKMRQAHVAHGDLSGVNVMLRADTGSLVLIDYDGVYIPPLSTISSLVGGQEDYQHSNVEQRPFDEWMDDFSALVIYTALLALRVQPALWEKYAKEDALSLLFEHQDFLEPQTSALIQELEQMGDPMVSLAVEALKQACLQAVDQVRFPQTLLDPDCEKKLARSPLEVALTTDDDHTIIVAFEALQQSPVYSSIVFTLEEKRRINLARRRNAALVKFQSALHHGSPRQIATMYDPLIEPCLTEHERAVYKLAADYAQGYNDARQLYNAYNAIQNSRYKSELTFTSEEMQHIAQAQQCEQLLAVLHHALQQKDARHIVEAYSALPPNANTYISERQRDVVSAAQGFIKMHEALQEAMRTGQRKLVLSHYDQKLASQFSGLSEQEKRYMDNVLVTSQLKQALHAQRYAEALTMARTIADPGGKWIDAELRNLLCEASRHFIKTQHVPRVTAYLERRRDGNYVVASWHWPAEQLVQDVVLLWTSKGWPAPPQEVQWLDQTWLHASRQQHQRERSIDFAVGRHTRIYLSIFAAVRNEWCSVRTWCFSDGSDNSSRREVTNISIR